MLKRLLARTLFQLQLRLHFLPVVNISLFINIAYIKGYYFYSTSTKKTVTKVDPKPALQADKFVKFTLEKVIPINHNTATFRFRLPEGTTELGLPTASCLVTKFVRGTKEDGSPDVVVRPYTPVVNLDGSNNQDYFDLIVKKYPSMSSKIKSVS